MSDTEYINIDDVKKVEIKIGEIQEVEIVEGADRLLKLKVNFGDEERQIVSGIREYFPDLEILKGKKCAFYTNLAPREIKGLESNGMILAAKNSESDNLSLLEVGPEINPGTQIS